MNGLEGKGSALRRKPAGLIVMQMALEAGQGNVPGVCVSPIRAGEVAEV